VFLEKTYFLFLVENPTPAFRRKFHPETFTEISEKFSTQLFQSSSVYLSAAHEIESRFSFHKMIFWRNISAGGPCIHNGQDQLRKYGVEGNDHKI